MNICGFSINAQLWQSLRYCQQESIQTALSYLRKPFDEALKSCLISLPTGAGKSGVISVVSHKATQKKTLVLCHRRAVCDQLFTEIRGKFFRERAPGQSIKLKKVFSNIDDTSANGIYVSTFQKLSTFDSVKLAELKKNIDLIIIDEGHAEPSPVWSTLVRDLDAHKIVITATPYRNDLFQFDISADYSFIYTFEKALADGVLKEPTFESVQADQLSNSIRIFLNEHPTTKCIIKCNKFEDVEFYYAQLNDDFNVLAIHDQYAGDQRENAKSSVPANLKGSKVEVIIHQRKLDEGVDIPQAKLLILTYPVGSGRELVQTIGRVVRVFGDIEPKVIEIANDANEKMWLNYRLFDASLNSQAAVKKFIDSLDANKLIELYLNAFPDVSYYGNRFLAKFDLNSFEPDDSLIIPTASICFLKTIPGFTAELLSDMLYWRCNNGGELAKNFVSSSGIHSVISIAFNRSKFLRNQFLFEPSLEVTLFKLLSNGVVAIFDSRGRRFNNDIDLALGSAVSQEILFKILNLGKSAKTREASSRSISTANLRPENIAIKGRNLDQGADPQMNASYRLSTAILDTYDGTNAKSGSFYIGVDSGRISDQKENSFSLSELNEWLETVDSIFKTSGNMRSNLIDSFAKPIPVDKSLSIQSVVFDFPSPVQLEIEGNHYSIDNTFHYRGYNNGLLLVEGVPDSKVEIKLISEEPYIEIVTEKVIKYLDVNGCYVPDIPRFLMTKIHKILLNKGVGYSDGKFYQLTLPIINEFDFQTSNLAKVVIALPELLNKALDEKGLIKTGPLKGVYQVVNQEFSQSSVFYLLDKIKSYSLPNPTLKDLGPFGPFVPGADILLNTDMGTEPADFIISSASKLIYVHVKCGDSSKPQSSAGALAEVGSQAIKNIEMLLTHNQMLKPGNWNQLSSPWPSSVAKLQMFERIRLAGGTRYTASSDAAREAKLDEIWETISQRRRSSAVTKEIWIVAANSFSLKDFSTQLKAGSLSRSETLQAYQLINSWISIANNNDVDLKIFVSP